MANCKFWNLGYKCYKLETQSDFLQTKNLGTEIRVNPYFFSKRNEGVAN